MGRAERRRMERNNKSLCSTPVKPVIPLSVLREPQDTKKGYNFNPEQMAINRKAEEERKKNEITRSTIIQVLGISAMIIADHFSQLIRLEVDGKDRVFRFLDIFYEYLHKTDMNMVSFKDIEKYLDARCGVTIREDGASKTNPHERHMTFNENKSFDYNVGFEDGLLSALRTVLNAGAKGLEDEIKFREITEIHSGFSLREIDSVTDKIKLMTMDTTRVMATAALWDVVPDSDKELVEAFNKKFDEGTEYLMSGYAKWIDYIQAIKEEIGIELSIRENN